MIADPYILLKKEHSYGQEPGAIEWYCHSNCQQHQEEQSGCIEWHPNTEFWQPYADFERQKLQQLNCIPRGNSRGINVGDFYVFAVLISGKLPYQANELIGYTIEEYGKDSESSRLLKRAEFLKAVCAKETVEWLPKARMKGPECGCAMSGFNHYECKPQEEPKERERLMVELSNRIKTTNEEREWRKALLDLLKWNGHFNKIDDPYLALEDLRKRFLGGS